MINNAGRKSCLNRTFDVRCHTPRNMNVIYQKEADVECEVHHPFRTSENNDDELRLVNLVCA